MFKIKENKDGTTSVYCKANGKLICIVKSRTNSMGLGNSASAVRPSDLSAVQTQTLKSDCSSDEDPKTSRRRRTRLPPLPEEPKEDFNNDTISPDNYARYLNLVPAKLFKESPLEHLNSTFPLRHYPRCEPLGPGNRDLGPKVFETVPLTSLKGSKLLKLNPQKHFYANQVLEQKVKSYDNLCHFEREDVTECSSVPKLRCREKRDYYTGSHKFYRDSYTHMYAFNKKQKLEKSITFKTGLNARSRKLLQLCKKQVAIFLNQLSSYEIQEWLSKRSAIPRPVNFECIQEGPQVIRCDPANHSNNSIITLTISDSDSSDSSVSNDSDYSPVHQPVQSKSASLKGMLNKPEQCFASQSENFLLPSNSHSSTLCSKPVKCYSAAPKGTCRKTRILKYGPHKYRECYVKVQNVLERVCKYLGEYYVRGTSVRIPLFSDYLNSLHPRALVMNFILDVDAHLSSPSKLQAMRRKKPVHTPAQPKTLNHKVVPLRLSNHRVEKSSQLKPLLPHSNRVHPRTNSIRSVRVPNETKIIPIIDISEDSPPRRRRKLIFKCHGCGFDKFFDDETHIKKYGVEHLIKFHSVAAPESFLSILRNDSYEVVVEAFPGYKRN